MGQAEATEHVAVFLLPGIFASHLAAPNGALGWPVNQSLAMLRHIVDSPFQQRSAFSATNSIRFVAHGPTSSLPPEVDVESGWQNVFVNAYKDFLLACVAGGQSGNKVLPFEPHVFGLGYNF